MKLLAFFALIIVPLPSFAEQGWVLVYETEFRQYREQLGQKPEFVGPASTSQIRVYMAPSAVRTDNPFGKNSRDPDLNWMFRKGDGQPTLVWPNRKTYSEQPGKPLTQAELKDQARSQFHPMGKTKTIAGYDCVVMARKHDPGFKTSGSQNWGTEEICLAIKLAPVFDLDAKFGWSISEPVSPWNLPKGMKGIPVEKVNRTASGFVSSWTTLKSAVSKEIPASLFEIPAGYKKMEFDLGKAFMEGFTGKKPSEMK